MGRLLWPHCVTTVATATAVASLLPACGEPASSPGPAKISLLTPDQWAGGEIVVQSQAFPQVVTQPVLDDSGRAVLDRWANLLVIVGQDTLSTRRLDDSTIAARLVHVANDTRAVTVVVESLSAEVGDVRIYGFAGVAHGPDVYGYLLHFPPENWAPLVLAYGRDGLLWVDLTTMSSQVLLSYAVLGDPWFDAGPGRSYRPGVARINRGEAWQLLPPGDARPDSGEYGRMQGRMTVEIGPGKVVWSTSHTITFCCPFIEHLSDPDIHDFIVSPDGKRVVPCGNASFRIEPEVCAPGDCRWAWPVFDEHGELLYTVGAFSSSEANARAAFSTTGDALFVAELHPFDGTEGTLFKVAAADGTLLAERQLDFVPLYVAADPLRPWIYVTTAIPLSQDWAPWVPAVMVIDEETLEIVAMPTAPPEASSSETVEDLFTLVDGDVAYLAGQWSNGEGCCFRELRSWRLDLLPVGTASPVGLSR